MILSQFAKFELDPRTLNFKFDIANFKQKKISEICESLPKIFFSIKRQFLSFLVSHSPFYEISLVSTVAC